MPGRERVRKWIVNFAFGMGMQGRSLTQPKMTEQNPKPCVSDLMHDRNFDLDMICTWYGMYDIPAFQGGWHGMGWDGISFGSAVGPFPSV